MKKRGFTLIELLASLAIISVLILIASQIFAISLKTSEKTYKSELDYKENTYAMLYIENVIRSSFKVKTIKADNETNVIFYVEKRNLAEGKTRRDVSTYKFHTYTKNQSSPRKLYAYIDNITNNSVEGPPKEIAECESLYLFYDEISETVHVILNENSKTKRYETVIYLDHKL